MNLLLLRTPLSYLFLASPGCAHLSPTRPANSRPFAPPYPRSPVPLLPSDREFQPISSFSRVSESSTPPTTPNPLFVFPVLVLSTFLSSLGVGRQGVVFLAGRGFPSLSPLLFSSSASHLRISRVCCTRSLRPDFILCMRVIAIFTDFFFLSIPVFLCRSLSARAALSESKTYSGS